MTAGLTVDRLGFCWAVFRGKDRLTGAFGSQDMALTAMRRADRVARLRPRPCLCCRDSFDSEGPHNRLCNACRRQTEPYAGVVGTQGRRVMKVNRG
jgi:hypothetical protein